MAGCLKSDGIFIHAIFDLSTRYVKMMSKHELLQHIEECVGFAFDEGEDYIHGIILDTSMEKIEKCNLELYSRR